MASCERVREDYFVCEHYALLDLSAHEGNAIVVNCVLDFTVPKVGVN